MIDTESERKFPTRLSELGFILNNVTYSHTILIAIFVIYRFFARVFWKFITYFCKIWK